MLIQTNLAVIITISAIVIPSRIGGVMVSVLSSSSINSGFEQHVYPQNVVVDTVMRNRKGVLMLSTMFYYDVGAKIRMIDQRSDSSIIF
jgi:hypothetical protein